MKTILPVLKSLIFILFTYFSIKNYWYAHSYGPQNMEALSSNSKWILSSFLKLNEKLIFNIQDITFIYYCLNNSALQPLYHYAVLDHDKKILQISFKPNHKFLLRTIMHFYISILINLEDYLKSTWKQSY